MKLLKVLNKDLKSPFRDFPFEIGREYICEDFDNSNEECSRGFYATDIEGLAYSYRPHHKVFEVEVGGREKYFDIYKRRFEKMKLVQELPLGEVKKLAIAHESVCGYKLSEALFPVNPLIIERGEVTKHEKRLLNKWGSARTLVGASVCASVCASVNESVCVADIDTVCDSVCASVINSVCDSVIDSVCDSVCASVCGSVSDSVIDSVGDLVSASVSESVRASDWASVSESAWASVNESVWAYIGSLFAGVKKWKYIEHKEGVYPFQACADLWRAGLVPSYDGDTWRLHAGKDAKIVHEQRTNNAKR